MRISDWSSDVCSSDLLRAEPAGDGRHRRPVFPPGQARHAQESGVTSHDAAQWLSLFHPAASPVRQGSAEHPARSAQRSEEHTSELQSLMRISYAVFCLKKKKRTQTTYTKQTRQQQSVHNTSPSF